MFATRLLNDPPMNTPNKLDTVTLGEKQTDFCCPKCGQDTHLHVGHLSATQVCLCPQCRGFVIDRASLGELVEILRGIYKGEDDKPSIPNTAQLDQHSNCPACFGRMETFHYCGPGNVIIDSCNGCELLWLDNGELGKMIRAPGKRDYSIQVDEGLSASSGYGDNGTDALIVTANLSWLLMD